MATMAATRTRSATWLDGLGEWSWPGATPAVELAPAAWVPAAPVLRPHVARPQQRRQTLPRPLRLARLAVLLAAAGATFVISSGVARSGAAAVAGAPAVPFVPVLDSAYASPSAAES